MIRIAEFQVPEDAHLFRCFLVSRGIEAHLFDEHVAQLCWHYSNAIGGVKVMVAEEDEETARECLQEYRSSLSAAPAVVTEARGWPVVLVVSLLMGLPLLLFGRKAIKR